jgi:alkylhydroperoxidase family enzyme
MIARMNRRLVDVVDDMQDAALGGSGRLAKSVRQAALSGDSLPSELASFVAKVRDASYRVTDEDFNALTALGLSEDEIFELTVAAAVGASADLVESALSALKT